MQTHDWFNPTIVAVKETPPSLLALTTYLLSKTGKRARGRLGERLAERDVRLWHMAVLAALADFGPHVQRDLAERFAIDPSDITKVLDDLTKADQVVRTRDPADRRRLQVEITETGRQALAALIVEAEAVQSEVLAPLSDTEQAQLHGLLLKIFPG